MVNAAQLSGFMFSAPNFEVCVTAATMCKEVGRGTGKAKRDARGGGVVVPQGLRRCPGSKETSGSVRSWCQLPPALTCPGIPASRAMAVALPGRSGSLTAAQRLQAFPGGSIPLANSPAMVTPASQFCCTLPSLLRLVHPLSPRPRCRSRYGKPSPAFPGTSSSSLVFAVPSPRGAAAGGFPLSRSLSFAFPGHAAPPGAGSLPPRLHHFPLSPAHATAVREMLGASGHGGLRDGGQRATAKEEPRPRRGKHGYV